MSEKKDDPREVLSLLNSLGFVGITAQQLKAFMKDLKMHRKIKERERQNWKDETKKKILLRQQELYREVLQEHKLETMGPNNFTESTISSESSTFQDDSSYKVVTVKIRCVPKDKENEPEDNSNFESKKKNGFRKTHSSWAEEFRQNGSRSENDYDYNTSSSCSVHESQSQSRSGKFAQSNNHSGGASTDSTKYISLEKPRKKQQQSLKQSNLSSPKSPRKFKSFSDRNVSDKTDNFKHVSSTARRSEDVPTNPPPSRSSVQSKTKSFIRPWRLQPETHKSSTNTKSDPVALYQKYKEEWKQLALPGEENHAGVRWAVREKMLGNDPNPRLIDKFNIETNKERSDLWNIYSHKEYKIYKKKTRKMRKLFLNCNSVGNISQLDSISRKRPISNVCTSISESILLNSYGSRSCYSKKTLNSCSIRPASGDNSRCKTNELEMETNFNFAESVSSCLYRSRARGLEQNLESIEIRESKISSAKETLGRLVGNLLNRNLKFYTKSYKFMSKCSCVLEEIDNDKTKWV